MVNQKSFSGRRKRFLSQLGETDVAILFAQSEVLRNGDAHYPFRQDSDFYYLTGLNEPDAVAVFVPGRKQGPYILFVLPKDPEIERWQGPRVGTIAACKTYGADEAFSLDQLNEKILELLANRKQIYSPLGKHKPWDEKIIDWFRMLQQHSRKNASPPEKISDVANIVDEMRVIKDDTEIELLRKAAQCSAQAHISAMQACQPGRKEFELEAILQYELALNNCRSMAYTSIVGGGKNSCILHYVANSDILQAGDLVLVDAGGEYGNYAADITRTFPVNGQFTSDQAAVYNVVLEAQLAVIAAIRPGLVWEKLHQIAVEKLTKGLISLGILSGSLSDNLSAKSYLSYYMHGTGHWLGLDVHDAGSYKVDNRSRPLKQGMVFTVEPGLYLSPSEKLDSRWWNIGIRIEDDVLVTKSGCEVLSAGVPKEIEAIEGLMSAETHN